MELWQQAQALQEETLAHRRFFHRTAEVGLHLPQTMAYVEKTLRAWGMEPQHCGRSIVAELGQGEKLLLLRADLDALPMKEESGLPFACTGDRAHACGHDCHGAMLLTAAKLLKERENQLQCRVRLLFQAGEETFEGALDAIAHGLLEPKPDAALAFHVAAGPKEPGMFFYNSSAGAMMCSVDGFEITIHGKGGHGAYPNLSVDPINIGVHLHLALQSLIARETDPTRACVLSVGRFSAGTAANIIPETAELAGTIRTNDQLQREKLLRRVEEVCSATARAFGGEAGIRWTSQVPPLCCDGELVREMVGYLQQLPGLTGQDGMTASASEDFASIAQRVPGCFIYLTAGFSDERGNAPAHNPKVQFHENVLPLGAAAYAHCALQWGKTGKNEKKQES